MKKLVHPLVIAAILVTTLSFSFQFQKASAIPLSNQAPQACMPFPIDGTQAGTGATGTGSGMVTLNVATKTLSWNITFQGLTGAPTGAHFHGPALPGQNTGIVLPFTDLTSPITGTATLSDTAMLQVLNGEWYVNIHTTANPNGEIRGQVIPCPDSNGPALPLTFQLDGAQAGTPSTGKGSGLVFVDVDQKKITWNINFQDLTGPPTADHFHGPAAPGQSVGVVLPFTDITNPIEGSATISDTLLLQVLNGEWYANIHTAAYPNGEIRGQVKPNIIPQSNSCLATPFPLNGAQAGTNSTGTGTGLVIFDAHTHQLTWNIAFQGLTGPAIADHFHGPAAAGQTAGIVLPFSDITSPIEGSAILTSTQITQVLSGLWYANIHTTAFPAGEIRGQVTPCVVNPYKIYFPWIARMETSP